MINNKTNNNSNTINYDLALIIVPDKKINQDSDWNDIGLYYRKILDFSCKPLEIKRISEGYIFNEDKSVKWNKEQVELNNRRYYDEVKALNKVKNNSFMYFCDISVRKIQDEVGYNLSYKKARAIFDFAYDKGHDYGFNSIYSWISELIDLTIILLSRKGD